MSFDQYQHLGVTTKFSATYKGDHTALQQAIDVASELPKSAESRQVIQKLRRAAKLAQDDDQRVQGLIRTMPEEALLKLDIAITAPATAQRLLVGVSSKWSLRTDRAQDCIAQGGKLVNLRRGHMPHYAVLTMEPRPSMLKLLAYGSGSLDCVYHLALDELLQAANVLAVKKNKTKWPPKLLLERMVAQGRIRPYSALVDEVLRLPHE
ncbi:NgoMIV family type II restriction endonuclease [Mycolicibacterium sp. Y3]